MLIIPQVNMLIIPQVNMLIIPQVIMLIIPQVNMLIIPQVNMSSCFTRKQFFYTTNTDHPFFHKVGPEQSSRLENLTRLIQMTFRVFFVS